MREVHSPAARLRATRQRLRLHARPQENVEDASRTEPKGGDEESDEAWQAIRCDDATYQCEEEDGRCEEEERRSPASLIEVPEPWDQERKDSRREG